MRSVLHGTWLGPAEADEQPFFFLWAEGEIQEMETARDLTRVHRHPAGMPAIATAGLLEAATGTAAWRNARRLTRAVVLPTVDRQPLVPRWLVQNLVTVSAETPQLHPWRVEGLAAPLLDVLSLLVSLPRENHQTATAQRFGTDLRYWGLVAKFCLEMLARQRFLPALEITDDAARPCIHSPVPVKPSSVYTLT